MDKISNFQLILRIIFGVFIVIAVLIFSGILPGFQKKSQNGIGGDVLMWGTLPESLVNPIIFLLNSEYNGEFKLLYEEKRPEKFESDLLEALASGSGPDMFILPHDLILRHSDKVVSISKELVSERDFKNTFVEQGELYILKGDIIALPLFVNPLVMYWNRDLFSSANIANPPVFWDQFLTKVPLLTNSDVTKKVTQSAVSFGEFSNVLNAKDIISMLILQTGNSITRFDDSGAIEPILTKRSEKTISLPVESVLRFYTEFSNPIKPTYSWNRSLPNSKNMFISEELAMYFGYASEMTDIKIKNPHLNFDVTVVPQIRDTKKRITYGRMGAVAITKNSTNQLTALQVALILSSKDFARNISDSLGIPPARRDLLMEKQTDAFDAVFYESALLSRAWLDPNPKETYNIFKNMIESVTSGRFKISEAVMSAQAQMERIR